ncbi:MAG: FAD-dependent oxidoreductase [Candidatus Binatus sp.]|jgi:pyruvate/2-oxoglutarate dehydrogenase complex dihydrolipoamide dehydrogenase (E3) component|uniref:dihydrolipoyl dehydrogenase family protein n=1 Tax=Candidatus Binatus sp. TaxID=2811406 RepID=UPI003CA3DA19
MPNIEKYENLVLGSGGSGKFIAWTMGDAGRRTAMVERRALGGSCPNVACLPSKNIIYSARVISLARRGAEFGLTTESMSVNMKTVQRRKRLMVEGLHQMHADRTKASGADLIMGNARFVAPRTVEIDLNNGGKRAISADRVFLDLGSRAAVPEVPGLRGAEPMTHVEALDLERLPEHLIVLGGGYVGLELSQAMRRLGSQVTVIEEGPQLASHEDPDIGAALRDLFAEEGIEVLLGTQVRQVEGRSGNRVQVHANDARGKRTIEGTDLLVATGRKANTDGIGLDLTGVQLDQHGYIEVNERLETTSKNIWAMGDCAGSPMFTHVAFDDFRIVHDNLNGGNRTTKNRLIPFCMFTDPELARVGRNESEARRAGVEYRLVKMPIAEILRTRTVSEPRGLMKMLIAKNSDEILGFTALGFEASELMVAAQTAMLGRIPYTMLRDAIFTHPTMSEGLNQLLANVPAKSA